MKFRVEVKYQVERLGYITRHEASGVLYHFDAIEALAMFARQIVAGSNGTIINIQASVAIDHGSAIDRSLGRSQ